MRRTILIAPLIAGLLCAAALTVPHTAQAWDINSLPNGYTIVGHIRNDPCVTYQIRGYGAAIDLSDCRPDFQDALDQFVEASCPQEVCHPAPPVTTTVASAPVTTTTVTDTTAAPTTTSTPPVTVTDTTATVTAPAPAPQPVPPTVTQTVLVQTVLVDPTINDRLTLLEQQQAVDQARLDALEHPTGQILGEAKNQAPFVAS